MTDKTIAALIKRVDRWLEKHKMAASRLGRNACNNASAVYRLRSGRYSNKLVTSLETYLDANP